LAQITLGGAPSMGQAQMCPGDSNLNGNVTIAEVQRSANSYLYGCSMEQPRFVDNGDGTISDFHTGLMWEKKVDFDDEAAFCSHAEECPDPHDVDNRYTWSASEPFGPTGTAFTIFLEQLNRTCDGDNSIPCTADARCTGIGNGLCGLGGHSDWRLPTREELVSIVDYATPTSPVVDRIFDSACTNSCTRTTCSCTVSNRYTSSSTTVGVGPGYAWVVTFFTGGIEAFPKTGTYAARAVRTGL
jgi:hypothetical protein